MKLSIFTPSHNPKFLDRAWESIRQQVDGREWEWVVLLNNGAEWKGAYGPQVKILKDETGNKNIGYLKRLACEMATGDVFVELDHDDELLPGCLQFICAHLRDAEQKAFLYSATHEVRTGGAPVWYGNEFGWHHATQGGLTYNLPFPITPRSLCEIFYAPNHVRAWTRAAYLAAGGHDPTMECADDHDLICRTYLSGAEFIGTDLPLYRQNIHGENSQGGERNARIQVQQAVNRDKYLTPLIHEWCRRRNLAMLDLGGAFSCPEGYHPVDVLEPRDTAAKWIDWDVTANGCVPDLGTVNTKALKSFAGIGCIRAKDFLEHVPPSKVVAVMNSIHANLVPGGWMLSMTPSTDGRGAWQDPTHCSFFNDNSWLYYTSEHQAKYVPEISARFQMVQGGTFFPGEWEKERNIPYTVANMSALHGQRQPGLIGFPRA